MNIKDLPSLADMYQKTREKKIKEDIVSQIFISIYFNLEKYGIFLKDKDDRSEFLLQFYFKIPIILETYKPAKSKFLTYLSHNLKFFFLTFKHQKKKKDITAEILSMEEHSRLSYIQTDEAADNNFNIYTGDTSQIYTTVFPLHNENNKKNISKVVNCKKMKEENRAIFLLACKACLFLNDKMIFHIAKKVGLPYKDMHCIITDIRARCIKQNENIKGQIYKRNYYYIRMKLFKTMVEENKDNLAYNKKLKQSYQYNLNLWKNCITKTRKQKRKAPSSRLIEEYVNISRATICKIIAKYLKKCYNSQNENLFSIR